MKHILLKTVILSTFKTQAQFAHKIGTTELAVSQVLYGRRKLTMTEAFAWAKILDCSINIIKPVIKKEDI